MNADEARTYGRHAAPVRQHATAGHSAPDRFTSAGPSLGDAVPDEPDTTTAGGAEQPLTGRSDRATLLRRAVIGAGALALVLAVLAGGTVWFVSARYADNIDRIEDVFTGLDENSRPAAPTVVADAGSEAVTFLLVGSDTRGHPADGQDPDGRSDAIMIARLSAGREYAQLISIPRDSWVDIPGYGMNKINASYAFGGPTLLIRTVEQLTGVRIDHYVAIDFDGIAEVTDALGGVDVDVAETTTNGRYTFTAGVNHINGEQARWYLGQRKNLAGGDFDRVKRQQQFVQAVFEKLFTSGTFTDPVRLDSVLRAITGAVSIDDTLSSGKLFELASSMSGLTPENAIFFTAPVLGTGREGAASVVYLDTVTGERMWSYLRSDSLNQNAGEFSRQALPEVPN